jgi:hypothetical protein
MSAGSTYTTASPNQWVTGNFQNTAAQPNCVDTIGNIFSIAGPRLERCTVMQPGYEEFVPFHLEWVRNQRYLPSVQSASGGATEDIAVGFTTTTASGVVDLFYATEPRVAPTGLVVNAVANYGFTTALANSVLTALTFSTGG